MKILHYTPSIDRTWGGTAFYMQLLAKEDSWYNCMWLLMPV